MKMRVLVVLVLCLIAFELSLAKVHRHEEDEESVEQQGEELSEEEDVEGGYDNVIDDPCAKKECGTGRECDLDDDNQPICVCTKKCNANSESRTKVCSTQNVTFESECELHRQRCMCSHKHHEECEDSSYRHAHLDYYGECKEQPPCEEEEMAEYPLRMRDWLYLVMEELARRNDLNEKTKQMADKAKTQSKRWVLPVIWKFCDLDTSLNRAVNPQELVPIAAPLKALEHCTGPFLKKCDEDESGDITLDEWGTCLGLDPEEIEDQCDAIRDDE